MRPTHSARDSHDNVRRRRGELGSAGRDVAHHPRATLDAGVPMTREKFRDAYFEGQPPEDIEEMDPLGVFQLLNQIGRRS
jgi:hypothetical protein